MVSLFGSESKDSKNNIHKVRIKKSSLSKPFLIIKETKMNQEQQIILFSCEKDLETVKQDVSTITNIKLIGKAFPSNRTNSRKLDKYFEVHLYDDSQIKQTMRDLENLGFKKVVEGNVPSMTICLDPL
jgi:hypothetical protein